jgi:tripartite-type tricarboxylate transporter receptor subunit TctC
MKRTFLARAFAVPMVLFISMNVPWQNLKDLAEAGKKDPSSIVWGTTAGGRGGGDIAQLQFFEAAGIDVPKTRRVEFTGGAPAINALAGGHIKFHAASPGAVFPAVTGGKAKAIGVSSPKRTPLLPDCPTTREAGFPSIDYVYWVAFSGPPGLPAQVIEVFSHTVEEILKDTAVVDRLAKRLDASPAFLDPQAFRRFVQEEANNVKRLQDLMTGGK